MLAQGVSIVSGEIFDVEGALMRALDDQEQASGNVSDYDIDSDPWLGYPEHRL